MDGRIDQDFNQSYRWKIPNTVGAYRIRPPDLNQDEWDKRIDQELVLNQDERDERMSQELVLNQDGMDWRMDQDHYA